MYSDTEVITHTYYLLKCAININAVSRRRKIHYLIWVAFMREPFVNECAISLFIKCAHLGYDLKWNKFIIHLNIFKINVKAASSFISAKVTPPMWGTSASCDMKSSELRHNVVSQQNTNVSEDIDVSIVIWIFISMKDSNSLFSKPVHKNLNFLMEILILYQQTLFITKWSRVETKHSPTKFIYTSYYFNTPRIVRIKFFHKTNRLISVTVMTLAQIMNFRVNSDITNVTWS